MTKEQLVPPIASYQECLLFSTVPLKEGEEGKSVKVKKIESHIDWFVGLLPPKWPEFTSSGDSHLFTKGTPPWYTELHFPTKLQTHRALALPGILQKSCRTVCVMDFSLFIQVLNHEALLRSNPWLLTLSRTILMWIHWEMPAGITGPIFKPVDNLRSIAYVWKLSSLPISWRWTYFKKIKIKPFSKNRNKALM